MLLLYHKAKNVAMVKLAEIPSRIFVRLAQSGAKSTLNSDFL